MERLTKGDGNCAWAYKDGLPLEPNELSYADNRTRTIGELMRKLADYEDAEEQGLLVRLPCKVGTKVYRLQYVDNKEMPGFFKVGIVETKFSIYLLSVYGETVFPTREEAEAALKEQSNDKIR